MGSGSKCAPACWSEISGPAALAATQITDSLGGGASSRVPPCLALVHTWRGQSFPSMCERCGARGSSGMGWPQSHQWKCCKKYAAHAVAPSMLRLPLVERCVSSEHRRRPLAFSASSQRQAELAQALRALRAASLCFQSTSSGTPSEAAPPIRSERHSCSTLSPSACLLLAGTSRGSIL